MKNNFKIQKHPFHLVDPSPWPLLTAMNVLTLTFGAVLYFHGYVEGESILFLGIFSLIIIVSLWWRDVIREATFLGYHTNQVQYGLRLGMLLFIISEIMFFASFFWAFFHSSISPSVEIGCVCLLMELQH